MKCYICSRILDQSKMIPVYCPLCCDQPFEDQQTLFFHLRGLRNNLFCPICSERFSSLEYLIGHLGRKCNGPLSPPEAKRKRLSSSKCSDGEPTQSSVDSSVRDQTKEIEVIGKYPFSPLQQSPYLTMKP
ncbi:hypothetical protein J6590_025876 [Homalodisca vitripennis]|nr:hypothetical protein J6590_025876 [Homalodisca vitripennis]